MSFSDDFADESSLEIDSELNDTRDSFFETPKKTSSPRKSPVKKAGKSLFKEPRIPLKVFSCFKCTKRFRTENTFKKHLRSHVFKDAASQVISSDNVKNAFQSSVDLVLADLIRENSIGDFSSFVAEFKEEHNSTPSLQKFKDIVCSVLSEGIVGKAFLMPSAMWGSLLVSVNRALTSADTRSALKEQLLTFRDSCPGEVCWPFVLEFFHKVAAAVSTTLTRSMAEAAGVKEPEGRAVHSTNDFSTERDKSTAFHIFGFVVKQFLNKALAARKSVYWKKILDTITSRFVKGGTVSSCPEGIEAWTASISRGSLTFVGEDAFNFFIALASVLQGMEERDGSLEHEAVMVKVSNTPALLSLWDAVIGNTLEEGDSFTFLTSVVKSVTNVMGVGIRDRRLNEEISKGSVNVALRSSLAPKKSAGSSKS